MEWLSPLDAAFLDLEDGDESAVLSIASVAVMEGPVPGHEELIAAVASRLDRIPRYRQRIRRLPFDLLPPFWADDSHFAPEHHFVRAALPAPGGEAELCELVGMVMAERLDRDHPLWQTWIIEGLAGGRWAVLIKIHHSMADGIAGMNIQRLLLDEPVEQTDRDGAGAGNSLVTMLLSPLHPRHVLRSATGMARGMVTMLTGLLPVKSSSLSGPIGRQRRYELAHARLSELREIGRAFGATVNDVALTAVTGALRQLLLDRGERPAAHSVRALVPVSMRHGGAEGDRARNQISLMLPMLPVDLARPVDRLTAVHDRLSALKSSDEASAGAAVTTAARFGPFGPLSWVIRIAARLPQRSIVTVATNVPGPRRRLSLLGRRILEIHPYVPLAIRLRTGVAVLTYRDHVSFGITSDVDSAPKPGLLSEAIEGELAELLAMARTSVTDPRSGSPGRFGPVGPG
ncbi:wax ester/triacylglycerol synthase family O-acyltransferase [Amycolatopsis pigmentata]|uniref:Diacylglycerol O-acyltransferase n=1 Tax=Amycolatopsis pigmentata TaxID=450801 RepID=A0ABW5FSC0_9PSEU